MPLVFAETSPRVFVPAVSPIKSGFFIWPDIIPDYYSGLVRSCYLKCILYLDLNCDLIFVERDYPQHSYSELNYVIKLNDALYL